MPKIECPACEARFQVSKTVKNDRKLKCSGCQHIFLLRDGLITSPGDSNRPSSLQVRPTVSTAETSTRSAAPGPSADEPATDSNTNVPQTPTLPIAKPESSPAESPKSKSVAAPESATRPIQDAAKEEIDFNPQVANARIKNSRRKSKTRSLILIGALSLIAIGLAGYFFYIVNQSNVEQSADKKNNVTQPTFNDVPNFAPGPTKNSETEPPQHSKPTAQQPSPNSNSASGENSNTTVKTNRSADDERFDELAPGWLKEAADRQARNNATQPIPHDKTRVSDATQTPPANIYQGLPRNRFKFLAPASSKWPTQEKKQLWSSIQNKLVRLIANRPTGKSEAIGLIVNSKGWVLTSLSAMSEATDIDVQQLLSEDGLMEASDLLKDKARGVVAVDPGLDMVVLSVNRKFVIALDDIQWSNEDTAVGSQLVMAPVFPEPYSRIVLREMNVAPRLKFELFSAADQKRLREAKLDDPNLKLIGYNEYLSNRASTLSSRPIFSGAPLFNTAGDVVGVSTGLRLNGLAYAVPAVALEPILSESNPTISPLSSLSSKPAQVTTSPSSGAPAKSANDIATKQVKQEIFKLNQAGSDCEAFGWRPKTQAEFDRLCELVAASAKLEFRSQNQNLENKLKDQIQTHVNEWMQKLDQQLAAEFDEPSAATFNSFARVAMQRPNTFFPAFAKVEFTAFEGPKLDGQDAVTFRVIGRKGRIMTPYDRKMPKMLPDSKWLLLCYPVEPDVINVEVDSQKFQASKSRIAYVFGPIQ